MNRQIKAGFYFNLQCRLNEKRPNSSFDRALERSLIANQRLTHVEHGNMVPELPNRNSVGDSWEFHQVARA